MSLEAALRMTAGNNSRNGNSSNGNGSASSDTSTEGGILNLSKTENPKIQSEKRSSLLHFTSTFLHSYRVYCRKWKLNAADSHPKSKKTGIEEWWYFPNFQRNSQICSEITRFQPAAPLLLSSWPENLHLTTRSHRQSQAFFHFDLKRRKGKKGDLRVVTKDLLELEGRFRKFEISRLVDWVPFENMHCSLRKWGLKTVSTFKKLID